uniref:Putative ovule protein n=1 Tax=Solanum chacoense TaxID=4108 RepID=A0A0V0GI56_SOLCH
MVGNMKGKELYSLPASCQTSFQNSVFSPFPTLIFVLALNSCHRDLMHLHTLTPYGVVTSLVIQLSSSTYFALMTSFQ